MDTTENITFTSKLTFWDKFKCFYLLHLYSLFSLYSIKKWVLYKNVCKLTKGLKASSEIIPLISRRNIHHLDIHNPCVSQF